MKVKSESEVAQSCLTLSDPMDCSLPGSSAHGIFQARVLEWDAIAFSNSSADDHLMFLHCMQSKKRVIVTAADHSQFPTLALRHHHLLHSLAHYSIHTGLSFFSNIPRTPLLQALCTCHLLCLGNFQHTYCVVHSLTVFFFFSNVTLERPFRAFLVAQLVKNLPAMQETLVLFLGWENALDKGKATHSSILA